MVTAEHRRTAVKVAQETAEALGTIMSERRACRLVGAARATHRYQARRPTHAAVRARLRELAAERPRWVPPSGGTAASRCCSPARATR